MLADYILWDKEGEPLLAVINHWLVDMEGEPVGFIERDNSVYNLQGQHQGWFEDGILRDQYGCCLGISDIPADPRRPRQEKPRRPAPNLPNRVYPITCPQTVYATREPVPQAKWSEHAIQSCFSLRESVL